MTEEGLDLLIRAAKSYAYMDAHVTRNCYEHRTYRQQSQDIANRESLERLVEQLEDLRQKALDGTL